MVNETNILNLIAKNPAPPESSFQLSYLETDSHERFGHVLQTQVDDSRGGTSSRAVSPAPEPKQRHAAGSTPTSSQESGNPAPAAPPNSEYKNNPTPPAPSAAREPQTVSAPETPPEDTANDGTGGPAANPVALTLAALLDSLNPAEITPGLTVHSNSSATGVQAAVPVAESFSDEGAAIDAFKQFLEGLNLDSETIDKLAAALQRGGAAELNGILNALRGLLQAAGQVSQAQVSDNIPEVAATRVNQPEQLALRFLIQAGLTEEEARQVVHQVQTANTSSRQVTENIAQPSKAAVEGLAVKPSTENNSGSGNLQNSGGESKPSSGHSPDAPRHATGLSADRLETLSSLVSPDKPSNGGGTQTNPLLLHHTQASGAQASGIQTAPGLAADGAPGQAPAAAADAAARGVDFVKPAVTETYNGRAAMDKPITAQIIEKFTLRGSGNHREVHIKLDPPSLGTVRMSVSTSGETVRATIVAENNIVKSVIESNLSQLKDAITQQGVKIDSFNVLVGGNASHSAHGHKEALEYFSQLGQGPAAMDPAEEVMTLHRPVFLHENQSFSIFA